MGVAFPGGSGYSETTAGVGLTPVRLEFRAAESLPLATEFVTGSLGEGAADALFRRAWVEGLDSLPRGERFRLPATVGAVAESVAAMILDELGCALVWQITRPGIHGVDLIVFKPDTDVVLAVEVKGTLRAGRIPRFGTARQGQLTTTWLDAANPGMAEWGLDSADVYGVVLAIDFASMTYRCAVTIDFVTFSPVRSADDLRTLGTTR